MLKLTNLPYQNKLINYQVWDKTCPQHGEAPGQKDIDLEKPAFKELLETIAENMPKLQFLCMIADVQDPSKNWPEYAEICQEFATGKNIKVEIRALPVLCNFEMDGIKSLCCGHYRVRPRVHPSKDVEIYGPK